MPSVPQPVFLLSLRARLALLVLVCVLPLLALNLGSIQSNYHRERERAGRQALDLARGLSLMVEAELRTRLATLEVLSLSGAARSGDIATLRVTAEAVLARQSPGASIALLRADGQQVMSTLGPPSAGPASQSPIVPGTDRQVPAAGGDAPRLGRSFLTGRATVSDMMPGRAQRPPSVTIEMPVRDASGRITQVLVMRPPLESFDATIGRQLPGRGWVISLLDSTGVRLARAPVLEAVRGQPAPQEFLRAWGPTMEGLVTMLSPEGMPMLAAYSRVPVHGWSVVVAVSRAELAGPAWRSALASLGIGLALLLAGLLLAHRIARGVTRPIAALRRLAAAPDGGWPEGRGPERRDEAAGEQTGLPEVDEVAEALRAEARRRSAATAGLRDSERRLRLVVAELNHRAKNALATVQALALQTARGDAGSDPARFATEFGGRLQTLARAHDLLTAFAWEPAALDAVLRAGLAPWLQPGGSPGRVTLRCGAGIQPPQASPGQAQAIVLALHELATNAVKHGALSSPEGRVEVTWRSEEEGSVGVITWQETGGPPVPGPPTRRGFGTRLLERMLVKDLGPGASVALDFHPRGVRAAIRFQERPVPAGGVAAALAG